MIKIFFLSIKLAAKAYFETCNAVFAIAEFWRM